ncbi:MAG TPA: mevalonate kinase [Chloroflexi bacterium]|nr:mevalonate kinase [Chloroflexota bacterium]HHW84599.1 mevalonate kinase [Chloroflexota bacterium]
MASATAPGKVILVGEHAVVYGRPAIAAPVWQVAATATIAAAAPGAGCTIVASDLGQALQLAEAGEDEPLAVVARLTLARLGVNSIPDWRIELHSDIPIASGLGSGAALSTALVRAIFAQLDRPAPPAVVSELVYESERFYHGAPSGIDNTVVAYGQPIWFVKGQPPQPFTLAAPMLLAIADTGIRSPTVLTVSKVRAAWQQDRARYEAIFDAIGDLVHAVRSALERGDASAVGSLFNENQALLKSIGVSCDAIDVLVNAARTAGASGAKLSGGGGGGNIIALVEPATAPAVHAALLAAGARRVIVTAFGA